MKKNRLYYRVNRFKPLSAFRAALSYTEGRLPLLFYYLYFTINSLIKVNKKPENFPEWQFCTKLPFFVNFALLRKLNARALCAGVF